MVDKPIRLTATDRKVLEHVALYKMTTEPVLERCGLLENASREVVKKRLQRLCRGGYLAAAPLFQQRRYYHLTQFAAKLLGTKVREHMFLKEEPKVRAYGGLLFCTDPSNADCARLSALEFRELCPELWKPGMRLDYYFRKQQQRLGHFRVDYAPKSPRWENLIENIKEFVARCCDNEKFQKLILAGGFELTIITAVERKAAILAEAFAQCDDFPPSVPVEFFVAGDLLPLIAPEPR